MTPSIPVRPVSSFKLSKIAVIAALSVASLAAFSPSASAQTAGVTTTNTAPATVLDSMVTGIGKMDDIAGVGAALGMASTIFGGTALILKRFVYS